MEFIKKYDTFPELKEEINKYTELLLLQRELPKVNELKAITKYIIFIKTIITHTGHSHYKDSLIFDILSAMHSLTGHSIRQFHYIFRSFIENYVRSMLNLDDNDETGVNQLFRMMDERFGSSSNKSDLLDFISGEYGKSCMYVHSNLKAKTNIQLYYVEIIEKDDFDVKTLSSTINKILITLKKMTELLIYSYPSIVENAFYRRKQQLCFLIGESLFNTLLQEVKTNE
ncbi:hypothetical protein [Peribacillus frigoritolerans]|uniref:hypothetical protein n=1 Tax=Peribacillus frigoritolerans TaxID=450367 RepID=UPI003018320B